MGLREVINMVFELLLSSMLNREKVVIKFYAAVVVLLPLASSMFFIIPLMHEHVIKWKGSK